MSRRGRVRPLAVALASVLAIGLARQVPSPLEAGTVIVSLLERPIGRETYEVRADGTGTMLTTELELVERGGRLQFASSLRLGPDLTPSYFRAEGRTYRFVNVDVEIDVDGDTATVLNLGETSAVALPERFFTAQSYAPLVGRAVLIRYWERHGRPAHLAVLPGSPTRDVVVEFRGEDTVRAEGREVRLRRYTVDGVVWGRESVWLDEDDRFAALTSRIHIMALEGIREDLRDAWPALQQSDIRDRMADLARTAESLPPGADGSFALVGARVIDGTGGAPIEDAVIVVRDGLIADVGPRAAVDVPSGVRLVDARGTTVTPGLWDMHAHASQIEWASAYLAAGVTSIRDMGGEAAYLTAFRDALAEGQAIGPRLFLAGLVDGDSDRALGATTAATPGEGRAVVDRYQAMGFDQMKLYSLLEADVVSAITSRAHELGMTVTGHVPTSLGLEGAVDAGMDQIAHLPGGAENIVERLARRVTIDPTMPWGELLGHAPTMRIDSFEPGIEAIPFPLADNYRSVTNDTDAPTVAARQRASGARVKALFDAGVAIVAGTDGAVPGHSLLRNLELFVEAGLTPMQALQAATIVPARAMGVDHDSGTVEPGKRADLLVLEANPLDDIRNVRRSRWVVIGGVLHETGALWRSAGFGG